MVGEFVHAAIVENKGGAGEMGVKTCQGGGAFVVEFNIASINCWVASSLVVSLLAVMVRKILGVQAANVPGVKINAIGGGHTFRKQRIGGEGLQGNNGDDRTLHQYSFCCVCCVGHS